MAVLLATAGLMAGCGDDAEPVARATVPTAGPTTTTASTTTTTTSTTVPAPQFEPLLADPSLTVDQQVEAAYLYYWEVVLDAFARGDGTALPLVLTGEALRHRQGELESLVQAGHRFQGTVEHDYRITAFGPDEAVVVDAERSRLRTTDAATGSIVETDPDEVVLWEYTLVREEDSWRISYVVAFRQS